MAEVKTVHFDYDSAFWLLKPERLWSRTPTGSRAIWTPECQAAGHCDERGTVEYNLALGQRRAQAVKDYYKALGIAEGRVATISYGKGIPVPGIQ